MQTIKCHNERNSKRTITKCNRLFGIIPDCVVKALKDNPGEKIICRCPTCPPYQKWASISFDNERGLVWEVTEKPSEDIFSNELKFDTVLNSKQIG